MKLIASLTLLAVTASPLSAAIIVSNNALTTGAAATLTITTDLNFTITVTPADNGVFFAFMDWAPTVGTATHTRMLDQFQYSLNGATVDVGISSTFVDHWGGTDIGAITTNTGYIYFFLPQAAQIGDTLTIKAGTYAFEGNSSLNPDIVQTFNGEIQIFDNWGNPIGPVVSVPEPSAALLGAVGALALLRRRR